MPLSGTFDTIQLCDVLQWIQNAARSGILDVSVELEDSFLVIQDGALAAFGSYDPLRLDLGQVLVARGLITEDQLAEVQRSSGEPGGLEPLAQLEACGIDRDTLRRVQTEHALECVLDMFLHEEGSFHFSSGGGAEGFLPPPDIPRSSYLAEPIPLQEILFEGMRRLDEWRRLLEVFPNSYVLVHALEGDCDNPAWRELHRAGEPISVGALCLRVGGSRFGVYRALYQGYQQGRIGIDRQTVAAPDTTSASASHLLEQARVLLDEQQFEEARAVLSTAANLDPDNQEARRLLRELRAAQIGSLVERIPPHRVPVLAVSRADLQDLRLPPREAYLASRLDGRLDVASLLMTTPLGELAILRILAKFLHAGIAKLR